MGIELHFAKRPKKPVIAKFNNLSDGISNNSKSVLSKMVDATVAFFTSPSQTGNLPDASA